MSDYRPLLSSQANATGARPASAAGGRENEPDFTTIAPGNPCSRILLAKAKTGNPVVWPPSRRRTARGRARDTKLV